MISDCPAQTAIPVVDLESARAWYEGTLGFPPIETPTLLVWGRQDRTVPFADSERIAGLLGAKLFVVEESGHTPHLERPEVFEPELVKFLRGEGPP